MAMSLLLLLVAAVQPDPCQEALDAALCSEVRAACAHPGCVAVLSERFHRDLATATAKDRLGAAQPAPKGAIGAAAKQAVEGWLSAVGALGETLPDGTPSRGFLAAMGGELPAAAIDLVVSDLAGYPGADEARWDLSRRVARVLLPMANAPLQARPLADRCALTRLLAQETIDAQGWARELPEKDGQVGFAVILYGDVPLLAPGEDCALRLIPPRGNRPVTLLFDPKKIVERGGTYVYVHWVSDERVGVKPAPLRFFRNFNNSAPTPQYAEGLGRDHAMMMGMAPIFEVEVSEEGGEFVSTTGRLVFFSRRESRAPAPPSPH
jgi:hypothetical protein